MKVTQLIEKKIPFNIIINSLFWICMYVFWLGFNYSAIKGLSFDIIFTLVDFLFFGVVSLITNTLLIPRFLYKRKYLKFLASYIIIIFIVTTMMLQVNYWMLEDYMTPIARVKFWTKYTDLAGSYILTFFLSSTAATLKLINDWYSSQQTISRLSEEKLKTELEFLKNQINPHSFFNILNTIYFEIDIDKEQAKNTLLEFAKIFRYQLYEFDGDKVEIEKEIEFVKGYIELQKKRLDPDYIVNTNFNISAKGIEIAPFLLLPLIENSFKHISQFSDKPNKIEIDITANDEAMVCKVSNTMDEISSNDRNTEQGGIGLKNLNRRLELLYKNKYELISSNSDGVFKTFLKLYL